MSEVSVPRRGIERAAARLLGAGAEVIEIAPIAKDRQEGELKQVGYGEPLLVTCRSGGEISKWVFRTMGENWYGHDRRSDRAQLALLSADTYAAFPRHIRCLEVGALTANGDLAPLPDAAEFYLVTTYAEGTLYADDFRAIERGGEAHDLDMQRVDALVDYLVDLHRDPIEGPPQLYERALRDLVGSGEGIFGIVDGYPRDGPIRPERLTAIERRCVDWRSRLRRCTHRLRRTHGDFHPYNILFRTGADFSLLDASRGGVGDPADDVAALVVNFIFGGVVSPEAWPRGFRKLWDRFWERYLDGTGDHEILSVLAPFLTWRLLVVASPVWYPGLDATARERLLRLAERSLEDDVFEPGRIERAIV